MIAITHFTNLFRRKHLLSSREKRLSKIVEMTSVKSRPSLDGTFDTSSSQLSREWRRGRQQLRN